MEHKVANFLPVDSQDFLKLVDVIILIGTTKQHSKSISDMPTGLFSQLIVYFVTFFFFKEDCHLFTRRYCIHLF